MKTVITIVILYSGLILAQPVSDSAKVDSKNQRYEQTQNHNPEMKSAQKQLGPKSNPNAKENSDRKKKDIFIDKDGDGICDSRQSGMSFNKLRQRLGSGQKGPGKGKHGSGTGNGNQNGFENGNQNGSGSN
jgi:hypothetical protein